MPLKLARFRLHASWFLQWGRFGSDKYCECRGKAVREIVDYNWPGSNYVLTTTLGEPYITRDL